MLSTLYILISTFIVCTLGVVFPLFLVIAKGLDLSLRYSHWLFLVHALGMHWLLVCRLARRWENFVGELYWTGLAYLALHKHEECGNRRDSVSYVRFVVSCSSSVVLILDFGPLCAKGRTSKFAMVCSVQFPDGSCPDPGPRRLASPLVNGVHSRSMDFAVVRRPERVCKRKERTWRQD